MCVPAFVQQIFSDKAVCHRAGAKLRVCVCVIGLYVIKLCVCVCGKAVRERVVRGKAVCERGA